MGGALSSDLGPPTRSSPSGEGAAARGLIALVGGGEWGVPRRKEDERGKRKACGFQNGARCGARARQSRHVGVGGPTCQCQTVGQSLPCRQVDFVFGLVALFSLKNFAKFFRFSVTSNL